MYNYNHLYYFFVTAKSGSVSNAAKFLHISQPSLSSQLKVLEAQMNKKLFEKKGRGLALTHDGAKMYAFCKKMFLVAEEMKDSLKEERANQSRQIHIGVSDQLERHFIADILSPMLKDRRNTGQNTFAVNSSSDQDLLNSLRSQEIDLLLTNRPVYGEDLEELVSVSMPVNLMVSSENMRNLRVKLPRNTTISDFMQKVPWGLVMPSEIIKLRQETDIFFQEIKLRKPILLESDIISVIGRAILEGAGFGFLPVPYMHEEIKHGLVSTFGPKQGFWKHMIYLIARKQENYDPALLEIKKSVREIEKMG